MIGRSDEARRDRVTACDHSCLGAAPRTHRVDAALLYDADDVVRHPGDERRSVCGLAEAHDHLLAVRGGECGRGRVRGRRRREAQERYGAALVGRELGGEHAWGRHGRTWNGQVVEILGDLTARKML
jgi:hypothetical protein